MEYIQVETHNQDYRLYESTIKDDCIASTVCDDRRVFDVGCMNNTAQEKRSLAHKMCREAVVRNVKGR